jgi:hypothetical protein
VHLLAKIFELKCQILRPILLFLKFYAFRDNWANVNPLWRYMTLPRVNMFYFCSYSFMYTYEIYPNFWFRFIKWPYRNPNTTLSNVTLLMQTRPKFGKIALTYVLPAVESDFELQNRDKVLSDSPSKFRVLQ